MDTSLPEKLYVETTTRCNLRCPMCVKHSGDHGIVEADMPLSSFSRLQDCLPSLKALVLNGIGEPLLNPALVSMVAMARARMPGQAWIGLQSNGTLLTDDTASRLLDAGLNRFCLSLDLMPGSTDASLGHPLAQSSRTRSPLARLAALRTGRASCDFKFGVEIVLMRDTITELPRLVSHAADMGCDFCLVSHLLPYHNAAQDQSLFNPNTREATGFLERWRRMADRQGLDLESLFNNIWQRGLGAFHPEVHALFTTMLAEARTEGIWLHLPSLFHWQAIPHQARWQECLDEAEQCAAISGLSLFLPPLTPPTPTARTCRFLEDRAIFVAVDGSVTPCHALWHDYRCYMDDTPLRFHARKLGNISSSSLATIWRSDEATHFRDTVLDYSCPQCFNCGCGPCYDIIGDPQPFASDCFGNAVPCGHCYWLQGGFRCL